MTVRVKKISLQIVLSAVFGGIIAASAFHASDQVLAQVMNSGSYKIQSDSINFGGGLASSTNYRVQDTGGELATGESTSTNFKLRAGYQQMNDVYLALSGGNNIVMSPSIGGVTGGVANGSTTVTAITDSLAGYQLFIQASSSPAMRGDVYGGTIADLATTSVPNFAFSYTATQAFFGFTVEGTDIDARYKDNGSACGTGSTDTTDACWDSLMATGRTISKRTSSNHPSGTATAIKFRVGVGSSANPTADVYTATTTVTMVAL